MSKSETEVTTVPTLSAKTNLEDAIQMFKDLLEEPNANAVKIGKLSDINAVAISQLKNGKMESITDTMYGKLKKLYDGVKAGSVIFEETKRGRKAGSVAVPKEKVAKVPAKIKTTPKVKFAPSKLGTEQKAITKEFLAQKESELATLTVEVEYLQEMKKLQDRFKGRLF